MHSNLKTYFLKKSEIILWLGDVEILPFILPEACLFLGEIKTEFEILRFIAEPDEDILPSSDVVISCEDGEVPSPCCNSSVL